MEILLLEQWGNLRWDGIVACRCGGGCGKVTSSKHAKNAFGFTSWRTATTCGQPTRQKLLRTVKRRNLGKCSIPSHIVHLTRLKHRPYLMPSGREPSQCLFPYASERFMERPPRRTWIRERLFRFPCGHEADEARAHGNGECNSSHKQHSAFSPFPSKVGSVRDHPN